MKRIFILLLSLLFFCGCSTNVSKSTPPIPDLNFSGNISVTYKKIDVECKIQNQIGSECLIEVLSPELLSGLKMSVKNGVCTFKLGDISYEMDSSKLKDTEFASSVAEALENALVTTTYEKLENGNWMYSGETSFGNFTLIQDSESGYPLTLRIPDKDLAVNFKNMKSNVQ